MDFLLRLGRKPRNVLWSTRSFLLSKIFFPNSPFFFFNRWKTPLFHSRLNIFPVSYSPSSFFFLPLLSTLSIDRDVKLNVWFGYNCNNLFSPDGQNICFARLFDANMAGELRVKNVEGNLYTICSSGVACKFMAREYGLKNSSRRHATFENELKWGTRFPLSITFMLPM